jgi:glycine/D-amino acid oxidase-like deaminating enzyme
VTCRRRRIESFDVGVVGGGICGVSVAALLAEEGLSVALFEEDVIAAAASGRNSGVIQRPFDPALAALHGETMELYRSLARDDETFQLPDVPAGLLLISRDAAAVRAAADALSAAAPELSPQVLEPGLLQMVEPMLALDLAACRLETGWPVAPALATRAMAERARRSGAVIRVGERVDAVVVERNRTLGLSLSGGSDVNCERVVIAAGPWTPGLLPGWSDLATIGSVWGVVASLELPQRPSHVLEELGIDQPGQPPDELFSMVTVGRHSSVGSTFVAERPEPEERAQRLLGRGAEFVPALAGTRLNGVRACARPQSFDGRPFIGAAGGVAGLFVCAGHGPWGISTGPGSARRLVEIMMGRAAEDEAFTPSRVA